MAGEADIGIRVFLDDAAMAGLRAINDQMAQMAQLAVRASGGFQQITGSMMGLSVVAGFGLAFVGFGLAIKGSIDAASQFQQAMFNVAVATHVPMSVALQYSSTLMNLAADSTYTSTEIAAGIALLGRSGYHIGEIFQYMAQAGVALGEATRSSAADGFRILAQVMTAYQLPADKAMQTADLLQFAFEHQTGTISQFSAALSQVTPTARQYNVSLEEVVAGLDTIGPAMTTVATAGTGLRYMMSGLYSPTSAAQKAMVSLGLASIDASGNFHSVFYDSKGNAIDFTNAIQILFGKLQGMSAEARNNALHELFSIRGGQGANVLYDEIGKYIAYIKQLNATSDNAGGAMARWREIMQTLGGATAGLKSSFTDLGVVIGNAIIPFVTGIITHLNGFVSMVRGVAAANASLLPTFLLLGAGIGAFGMIAGIVVLAINGIGVALLAMVGIALGVAAGTAVLAAGITLLIAHFSQVRAVALSFVPVIERIGAALLVLGAVAAGVRFSGMVTSFLQAIPAAIRFAVAVMTQVLPAMIAYTVASARVAVSSLLDVIALDGGLVPAILTAAGAWLVEAGAMLVAAAPFILIGAAIAGLIIGFVLLIQRLGGLNMLLNLAKSIWAALAPVIMQAGNTIRTAFLQAVQQLTPVWNQLVAAFRQATPMLLVLGAVVGGILAVALAVLMGIIRGLINVIVALLVAAIRVVAGIIQAFAGLIQFFAGLFTVIHGLATGNFNEILAGFRTMGSGILNIALGLWNAVKAVFVGAFQAIVGFVSGFVQGIIGFFHMLSSVLVGHSIVPDMMTAILAVFTAGFNVVRSIISAGIQFIISLFTAMQAQVSAVIHLVVAVITTLFTQGFSVAVAVAAAGIANIISRFMSMPGPIGGVIRLIVSTAMGFASSVGGVASSIAGAVGRIVGAFQGMAGGIAGAIQGAIGWVNNLMGAINSIHMPSLGGFSLPHFASGGIVTSPTLAVVGEGSEPEIVLPVSKYQAAMQGAANMSASGGSGNGGTTAVNLYMDSKIIAQLVMNNYTGQLQMNGLGRYQR